MTAVGASPCSSARCLRPGKSPSPEHPARAQAPYPPSMSWYSWEEAATFNKVKTKSLFGGVSPCQKGWLHGVARVAPFLSQLQNVGLACGSFNESPGLEVNPSGLLLPSQAQHPRRCCSQLPAESAAPVFTKYGRRHRPWFQVSLLRPNAHLQPEAFLGVLPHSQPTSTTNTVSG